MQSAWLSSVSKRILFIIFALVVSGATVALVRVSMNGSSKLSASRRLRASTSPPMTRVLVATLGLPAGSVLQSNQMRWQNWPVDSAAPYATEGHASVGSFVGGVVRSRLTAGEPILASNVSRPGERGFMAAVLDPGSSAVTINVTPSTGMAGFISPGDRVDLLLTMTQPPGGAAPAHRFSETLLTNLRVVGVDQSLSDDKKPVAKDAPTPKTITLQVTSKQAEVVALGSEIGILSLSLKSLSSWSERGRSASRRPDLGERGEPCVVSASLERREGSHAHHTVGPHARRTCIPRRRGRRHRRANRTPERCPPMKASASAVLLATIIAAGELANSPARASADAAKSASDRLDLEIGRGRLIHLNTAASSVFVASPKIADVQVKSPTLIYVFAKATGATSVLATDDHDATILNLEVAVHYDVTRLEETLKRLLPDSEIGVSTANNALVLTGSVATAADALTAKSVAGRFVPDADHLINTLRVDAPSQISLRVRVVEVSRDIIKTLGFNWGAAGGNGQFALGLSSGSSAGLAAAGTGLGGIALHQSGVDNILAAYRSGNVDINLVIDALDSEGLATVLAEPNLTAISGAPASFLAGGEYPIPVPQGLNTVTIEYKKYGVSLAFVATITDGNRINLEVKPEVSQLSNSGAITLNGVTVPALTTRRAETTVDLASGQSLAIAGLMQNNVTHDLRKTPGLGYLPGLGTLFRSDRLERQESELVVIVTPYLVRPSNKRLAAPTDGYVAPTDAARILKGADYTPTGRAPVTAVKSAHKEPP